MLHLTVHKHVLYLCAQTCIIPLCTNMCVSARGNHCIVPSLMFHLSHTHTHTRTHTHTHTQDYSPPHVFPGSQTEKLPPILMTSHPTESVQWSIWSMRPGQPAFWDPPYSRSQPLDASTLDTLHLHQVRFLDLHQVRFLDLYQVRFLDLHQARFLGSLNLDIWVHVLLSTGIR